MALSPLQRAAQKEKEEKQKRRAEVDETSRPSSKTEEKDEPKTESKKKPKTDGKRLSPLQRAAQKEQEQKRAPVVTPNKPTAAPTPTKRRTMQDIYADLDKSKNRLTGAQQNLDRFAERYGISKENAWEDLATKYGATKGEDGTYLFQDEDSLTQFNRVSAALSGLYDTYTNEYNTYSGLYDEMSNFRTADSVGFEVSALEDEKSDLLRQRAVEMDVYRVSGDATKLVDIQNKIKVIDDKLEPLLAEQEELKALERQDLIDSGEYHDANLWDLTGRSVAKGYLQARQGQETYKAMKGWDNKKAEFDEKLAQEKYQFLPDGKLEEFVSGGAELAGQISRQYTDPRALLYALESGGLAMLAGNAGPQAIVPEEVVSVPTAIAAGFQIGGAQANYEIEAGHAYNEMIDMGISPKTASIVAEFVGGGNALLEMVQMDDLLKSFKALKSSAATQNAAKMIGEYLENRGVHVLTETSQEVAQEAVTMLGGEVASRIDKGESAYTWDETLERLGDTAVSSAGSFAVMGIPGDVVNITSQAYKGKQYADLGEKYEYEGAADDIIASGLEASEETDAHKIAVELQDKQTRGETITNEEIGRAVVANAKAIAAEERVARANMDREARQAEIDSVTESAGYGENGAKTFASVAMDTNADPKTVMRRFDTAYQAGLTGLTMGKTKFSTTLQVEAFNAGRMDHIARMAKDKAHVSTTILSEQETGFDHSNAPADVTKAQRDFSTWFAQKMGVKGVWDGYDGVAYNGFFDPDADVADPNSDAGIVHFAQDFGISPNLMKKLGSMDYQQKVEKLASKREESFVFYVGHEIAGHVAMDRAPVQMRAFANAMYNYKMSMVKDGKNLARDKTTIYAKGGVKLDTDAAIEEVISDSILELYDGDEQAFMDAMRRVYDSLDEDGKKGAREYGNALKRTIAKLKAWVRKLRGKGETETAANVEKGITELEHLRQMFEEAIAASMKAVKEAQANPAKQKGAAKTTSKEGIKNSIKSFADAAGIEATRDENGVISFTIDGEAVTKVTADHIKNHSGLGVLITVAQENGNISAAEAKIQYKAAADIMNMILNTQDPDMVWAWVGSSMFSAIKSNADGQYGTTIDFTTVCRKTQDMITAMSKAMMKLKRGLTKDEVTQLQAELIAEGSSVPCPVCYVFSRWAGIGSVLDNMYRWQNKYDSYSDARIQKRIAELTEKLGKGKSKDLMQMLREQDEEYDNLSYEREKLNLEKRQLNAKKRNAVRDNDAHTLADINNRLDEIAKRMPQISKRLKDIKASVAPELAWLLNVRSQPDYAEHGKVRENVLFNLDDAAAFAEESPLAWKYRTSRGPSAGKAILPYSDMRLGDMILGVGNTSADGNTLFANVDGEFTEAQRAFFDKAVARTKAQNLIGGQRFQSTSDFRYDYALDYLMAFWEAQALGSKMQTYTKIIEFGDMVAAVGGDFNLSVMPRNKGYVTLPDGTNQLIFSSVTGINFEAAVRSNQMHDNGQLILVGINDNHILAALEDSAETRGAHIGFVIPYHASGASINEFIRVLVSNLGETYMAKSYQDYSKVQTDSVKSNATADQKRRHELRSMLLRGKDGGKNWSPSAEDIDFIRGKSVDITDRSFADLRAVERKALRGDKAAIAEYESWTAGALWDLYNKMWVEGGSEYGVRLNTSQAAAVMPHEYWNKTVNRDKAYINGFLFRSYCYNLGLTPRFSGAVAKGEKYGDFTDSTGYWKTLIDRPMYNNDGTYRDQQVINMSKFNMEMLNPEYAKKNWAGYSVQEPDVVRAGRAADRFVEKVKSDSKQFSLKDRDYAKAVKSGDMETAQRMVDEAAKAAGYAVRLYHGTKMFGFTKFDPKFSDDKISIFASTSNDVAQSYSGTYEIKRAGTKPKTYRADKLTDAQIREALSSWHKFERVTGAEAVRECVAEAIAKNAAEIIRQVEYRNKTADEYFAIPAEYSRVLSGKVTPYKIAEMAEMFTEEQLIAKWGKNAPGIGAAKTIGALAAADYGQTAYVARDGKGNASVVMSEQAAAEEAARSLNAKESNGNYALYGNTDGMLVIDGKGANWNDIPFSHVDGGRSTTREIVAWAHKRGYTGVVFKNIVDNANPGRSAKASTVYAFFSGNQLKSADPVTYDRFGRSIPLSKRFNKGNKDIRYSLKDSDYMAAVEAGDMKTAQRMVDEAAKEWGAVSVHRDFGVRKDGMPTTLYHGTPRYGFTVFEPHRPGQIDGTDSIFMATDASTAPGYQYGRSGGKPGIYKLYARMERPLIVDCGGLDAMDIHLDDYSKRHILDLVRRYVKEGWESVDTKKQTNFSSDQIMFAALKSGEYDGVIFKYVKDGYYNNDLTTAVGVFDSNQVKSADPVTYDDTGNVIPLSKRFDSSNDDIRYSLKVNTEGLPGDVAQESADVITALKRDGMASRYGVRKYASYTSERIEAELQESIAEGVADYAHSYIAWVDPMKFLHATTTTSAYRDRIRGEAGDLRMDDLRANEEPIYLIVNEKTGEVVGHEGRHRMTALMDAGVERVATIIRVTDRESLIGVHGDKYNGNLLWPKRDLRLKGQKFDNGRGSNIALHDLLPLSERYADAARQLFSEVDNSTRFSLKGEREIQREIDRIRKEGKKAGKSEADIESEVDTMIDQQYGELIKTYGEIKRGENPARGIKVPQRTSEKKKVSQTVRTILEAKVTPESALPKIQEMIVSGDFSYDIYTDEAAINNAEDIIRTKKYPVALAEWIKDVEAGKVSKTNTALGWALYNQAATDGDMATAMTILNYMVGHQRNAAQAVQATRILKKLEPDAQLYGVVRSVQKLEEDLNTGKRVDETTAKRAAGAVGQAKKDAAGAAAKAHSGVKVNRRGSRVEIEGNQAGEPFVFEYAQKVGEALAHSLEAKRNRPAKQEKTFLQHIVAELNRFAAEKLPKEKKDKPLTAVDLLRDYIQNQAFFAEAWQAAQVELREKYADDQMLGEFINSGIGVDANANPQNAIFMRALVKAAADSKEGKAILRKQDALGFTGMADTIADNLIQQTGATGEMADTIRDAAHAYVYDAVNEVAANEKKTDDIKIVDAAIRGAMKDIGVKMSEVVLSGNGEAVKQAVVAKLVGKYGFGMAEATHTADVVAERFDQMSRKIAENKLKSMFKERSNVRKTLPERIERLARLGAFDVGSAYNQQAAEHLFKVGTPLTVNEELATKFLMAKTQEERDAILADIYRDVGRQMPATFMDKWNAWRYLAMLGNPRTHVRNVVGNLGFAPVVATKNMTAGAIESVVSFVSGGKLERNKGRVNPKLLQAAWADYDNVADEISAGGKYSDAANKNKSIEEGRTIFKFKPLEKARKKNSEWLETEDIWFARPHYAFALAQYCKAHGVTVDQLKRGKALGNARAYAIKEAQKATYKDTNAFSDAVAKVGRYSGDNKWLRRGSTLIEGVLPFRKTPANILARGVEYSPIGLLKSLTADLHKVSKGDMTGAEAIDNIAAGMTGTMLLGFGLWAAAQGLIRGSGGDDEEEKKFDELQGRQSYALELPNGKSITLDWLAPEALPMFIGVNLYEIAKEKKSAVNLADMLKAVTSVGEPLLEMSCLQSLNDLLDSNNFNGDLPAILKMPASAATSYLTQAFPTILGQAERSTQDVRMTTYTEKDSFLTSDMQYTLGKISAKTPGWDFKQIPYIDAWGRTESTGSKAANAANNFLNPAYTSQIETSKMEEELQRLYDATGEKGVLPDRAPKYFTVDKERKDLTGEEYVEYATERGQRSYDMLTELTGLPEYKDMTDEEKAEAVDMVFEYADAVAKTDVSNYKPTGWVKNAIEGDMDEMDYILYKMALTMVDKPNENGELGGSPTQEEKAAAINLRYGLSDSDIAYLWDTKDGYMAYEAGADMRAYVDRIGSGESVNVEKMVGAMELGVSDEEYYSFLDALEEFDEPSESGKLGTFTQKEATKAVASIPGLTDEQRAYLWQSMNKSWKKNPWK